MLISCSDMLAWFTGHLLLFESLLLMFRSILILLVTSWSNAIANIESLLLNAICAHSLVR